MQVSGAASRVTGRRRGLVVVAVATAIGSTGAMAGTAGADTTTVACTGPGGGASALVAAVSQANSTPGPDTIDLAAGCTYALTAAATPGDGLPVITGQLRIRGHGATVERSSPASFRILEVGPDAALTLEETTVAGGAASLSGATAFGGGILNGGRLTVTSSTIRDNQVSGSDSSAGGGGIANNGVVTLRDTVLRDNRASATGAQIFSAVGGAILNRTGARMTIEGGRVVGNRAVASGASPLFFIAAAGGIGSTGTLRVTDTRIAGNQAIADGANGRANGGGMSIADGTVSVAGATLSGNTATASGAGAAAHGGGLENGGLTTLLGTTVQDNRASGPTALGGGIITSRRLTVVESRVTGNVAAATSGPGQGGGIFREDGPVILYRAAVVANLPDNCQPTIPGC